MRQSLPHAPTKQNRSLQKFTCPHIDKTFPDLVDKFRKDDSTSTGTKRVTMMNTMRDYEKKFYHDEVNLLLQRIQALDQKCSLQELEIVRLRAQLKKQKQSKRIYSTSETSLSQECQQFDKQIEDPNSFLTSKLKQHYETKLQKIKSQYQKKIREKDRQKANACKALQFEHHCQVMEIRFEEEKLRTEKQQIETELGVLKKKMGQIEENLQKEGKNLGLEIQSYKEENALLRSFIYKVQMAEQELVKLEESRKKQRQQFVVYAQQSQSEKRQLLKEMEALKIASQQKAVLMQADFQSQISQKEQKIRQLSQRIEQLQKNCNKQTEKKLSRKSSQNGWQKIDQSLRRDSSKKQLIAKAGFELDGLYNVSSNYYRQMQRLRIERNHIALQNSKLAERVIRLQQELTLLKIHCEFDGQDFKSKLSQFNIPEVQSDIKEDFLEVESKVERLQQREIIEELEAALKREEEKIKHMNEEYSVLHNYYKTKQNSMKLTLEMSENSYKELWEKHCILLSSLKNEREAKQNVSKLMDQLKIKVENKEHELLQQKREKELINIECEALREKYQLIKQQCDEMVRQSNEKIEQDEIILFRQKKQLERYERDIELLNQKLRTDYEQLEKEKTTKNEEIQGLKSSLSQIKEALLKQQSERCHELNDFQMKQQMWQKIVQQLEQTISKMRKQYQQLFVEKEQAKSKLTQLPYKQITTLFPESVEDTYNATVGHYQQQICQINANHQNEIDHLKQYIHELMEENDQLRDNYTEAAQTWRQMYEGVVKYNKFVDEGQLKLESSTARKREIAQELESKDDDKIGNLQSIRMIEELEIIGHADQIEKDNDNSSRYQVQNKSEVFTVPDFSERKVDQIGTDLKPISHANQQKGEELWDRNLSKNLEKQFWRVKKQSQLEKIIEEQENSDSSNRGVKLDRKL